MATMNSLYRHGDVLVQRIDALPTNAEHVPGLVLAEGELTGHAHRIQERDGRARLLRDASDLYLEVDAYRATLVHEEHGPIELPKGKYRVWQQREYVPVNEDEPVTYMPVVD